MVGREQAEAAARQLADLTPGAPVVVASDLARTAETAAIIAGRLGLPLEFDPGLREQNLGSLEGTASVTGDGRSDVINEFWDEPYRQPPGGESVADMYQRVRATLGRLTAAWPGATPIVVTHGGPVRVATADRLPPPGHSLPRGTVANASIKAWPTLPYTEMVAP